ncbi:MAG: heterocyst development glycosyltransferase HepC [Cyanobacteria bacterium J06554_6]
MISTTVLLKTPQVFQVAETYSPAKPAMPLIQSALHWRQHLLIVRSVAKETALRLPALQNQQWFRDCLNNSPVKAVRLDLKLGEEAIKAWADSCQAADKRTFLSVPARTDLPQTCRPMTWPLKRLADWLAASVILLLLSPLLVLLAFLIRLDSTGPIFYKQWRVGVRGELFQVYKFRTMYTNAERLHHHVMGNQAGLHKLEHDPRVTGVGRWLRKYSLDELPQLFNVLQGEMSLVGPRPWALYDAVRVPEQWQHRLNAVPGITGAWQVEMRSQLLDLDSVNRRDCQYLGSWSLWQDFTILLRTIPKVISGAGAY